MGEEAINGDLSVRAVVDTTHMEWTPSPSGSVWRKRVHLVGPPESGQVTSVVRYEPHSRFPAHDHPEGEEILVLEGVFSDEHGDWPAGTFLLNPEGFRHSPVFGAGMRLVRQAQAIRGPGTAPRDRRHPRARLGAELDSWRDLQSALSAGRLLGPYAPRKLGLPSRPGRHLLRAWCGIICPRGRVCRRSRRVLGGVLVTPPDRLPASSANRPRMHPVHQEVWPAVPKVGHHDLKGAVADYAAARSHWVLLESALLPPRPVRD